MDASDDAPVPVPFTFPELFARQRIALKMTQRQVAEALAERGFDFTAVSVSNWERGKNPPRTSDVVYALEDVLDCPGEFSEALGLAPAGPSRYDALEARIAALEADLRSLISELRAE